MRNRINRFTAAMAAAITPLAMLMVLVGIPSPADAYYTAHCDDTPTLQKASVDYNDFKMKRTFVMDNQIQNWSNYYRISVTAYYEYCKKNKRGFKTVRPVGVKFCLTFLDTSDSYKDAIKDDGERSTNSPKIRFDASFDQANPPNDGNDMAAVSVDPRLMKWGDVKCVATYVDGPDRRWWRKKKTHPYWLGYAAVSAVDYPAQIVTITNNNNHARHYLTPKKDITIIGREMANT